MGITGLNPINLLLVGTLVAYLLRGRLEHPGALVPRPLLLAATSCRSCSPALIGTMHVDDIHAGLLRQRWW